MFFGFTFFTAHYIFHFFFPVFDPLESVKSHESILESSCLAIVSFFLGWENVWGYQCIFFLFVFLAGLLDCTSLIT